MTAVEIIVLRTGMTAEKATQYAALAEQKVREYLRYDTGEDVSRFASTVADVAVLYNQRDTQVSSLGSASLLKSASFSEGGVSESKTYLTAGELFESYDARADKVLDGIMRYRRAHVVTGLTDESAPSTTRTVRVTEG